jgi:outer membrane protein assembly factor BamB
MAAWWVCATLLSQTLVLSPFFLLEPEGQSAQQSWPQWRGPNRDGRIVGGKPWPNSLKEDVLTKKWRFEMGPSYSGPIVVGNRIFVTETKDKKYELAYALDRGTGKVLWQVQWEGSMTVPFFAKANGDWIRSTPAFDGKSLYVAGMRDVLVCIDAETGKVNWRLDFVEKFGTPLPTFGFVASPLVDGDAVYVQAGAAFVKLNKHTGAVIWQTLKDEGGMNGSAFSSPVIQTIAGRRQLVVQTRTTLAGVDIDSGSVLWSRPIPAFRGMNILTPSFFGDKVFTSSHSGGTFMFDLKADESGKFAINEVWKSKVEGYMSSPIIIGDHAYLHLRNQRFTCFDLKTGKQPWTTGKPFGKYWSMVAQGDKILALDETGDLLLIRANPEKFDLIDSRKITDIDAWAYLAVCDDEVFVRDRFGLTVYQWK